MWHWGEYVLEIGPSPDGSRVLPLRWWSPTDRRRNHARDDRL
jgi:hypothetical protein